MPDNDPSVFFSAERTLLAWIRTGVTTIGLGFVVARFRLFLQIMLPDHHEATNSTLSAGLGVALVLLGAACCMIAAFQITRFRRNLPTNTLPPGYSTGPSVVLALGLATVGVILAVSLLPGA